VHLEVVSISESDELRSAEIGRDLGVDYILGGTRWRSVSELLAGSGIKYFPYPGRISQHPAVLDGSVTQIVDDVQAMGSSVDGINLLAYRHVSRDGAELLNAVRQRVLVPIIAAGSIDSVERIRAVRDRGAWGFTIGAAALDLKIVPGGSLVDQIEVTLSDAGRTYETTSQEVG
jgi:hypothetical protein